MRLRLYKKNLCWYLRSDSVCKALKYDILTGLKHIQNQTIWLLQKAIKSFQREFHMFT